MIAEIIAVGSEMLTPHRTDTNSLYLTAGLNRLGVSVAFKTIVGDNFKHLTSAAAIAMRRADIVIFSGGLGPTEDDLTRAAVAATSKHTPSAAAIAMRRADIVIFSGGLAPTEDALTREAVAATLGINMR